ncbi:Alpha/Beta hydrolase protein [Chytriomyces sp. MP71]|nr:Alpha/Beta hydrolase protein [Chytriomyces sp. MP71]
MLARGDFIDATVPSEGYLSSTLPSSLDQRLRLQSNVSGFGQRHAQRLAVANAIARAKNASVLIRSGGFGSETHRVEASDGAWLTLRRVTLRHESSAKRPVALLWPGFGGSANCFVCAPRKEDNLAFVLAEAGFDVWLGNPRGVDTTPDENISHPTTSQDHTTRPTKWAFSIDDIVSHDIPSVVDFVLAYTHMPNLSYIGISQGTTAIFAALAVNEPLNSKINIVIALAPTLKPMPTSLNPVLVPLFHKFKWVVGEGAFPSTFSEKLKQVAPPYLTYQFMKACTLIGFQSWDFSKIGDSMRQVAMVPHSFNGTSRRVVEHWIQTIESQTSFSHYLPLSAFRRGFSHLFDHVSHTVACPHITTRLHLFYSRSDNITDIDHLQDNLPVQTIFTEIKNYSHIEFLFALDVKEKVYDKVIDILCKMLDKECI